MPSFKAAGFVADADDDDDGQKYRSILRRFSGNSPQRQLHPNRLRVVFVDCCDGFSSSYSLSDFGLVGRGGVELDHADCAQRKEREPETLTCQTTQAVCSRRSKSALSG